MNVVEPSTESNYLMRCIRISRMQLRVFQVWMTLLDMDGSMGRRGFDASSLVRRVD